METGRCKMINMNINERKKLKFGVAVSGVQTRDLAGTMRILIDGVEYGFQTSVLDDKILVEIPPLNDIVKTGLREGRTLKAKLDIDIADTHLTPWADTIKLITPVTVKASLSEEEDVKKQSKKTITLNLEDEISEKKAKKQLKEDKPKNTRKKTKFSEMLTGDKK